MTQPLRCRLGGLCLWVGGGNQLSLYLLFGSAGDLKLSPKRLYNNVMAVFYWGL